MNTTVTEKAMVLALVAIALSFATIAPGLGRSYNIASADSGNIDGSSECTDEVVRKKDRQDL